MRRPQGRNGIDFYINVTDNIPEVIGEIRGMMAETEAVFNKTAHLSTGNLQGAIGRGEALKAELTSKIAQLEADRTRFKGLGVDVGSVERDIATKQRSLNSLDSALQRSTQRIEGLGHQWSRVFDASHLNSTTQGTSLLEKQIRSLENQLNHSTARMRQTFSTGGLITAADVASQKRLLDELMRHHAEAANIVARSRRNGNTGLNTEQLAGLTSVGSRNGVPITEADYARHVGTAERLQIASMNKVAAEEKRVRTTNEREVEAAQRKYARDAAEAQRQVAKAQRDAAQERKRLIREGNTEELRNRRQYADRQISAMHGTNFDGQSLDALRDARRHVAINAPYVSNTPGNKGALFDINADIADATVAERRRIAADEKDRRDRDSERQKIRRAAERKRIKEEEEKPPFFAFGDTVKDSVFSTLGITKTLALGGVGALVGGTAYAVTQAAEAENLKVILAGLVNTNIAFRDGKGKPLNDVRNFQMSQQYSQSLYDTLRERSTHSVLTTKQEMDFFMAGFGPLAHAKVTPEHAVDIIDKMATIGKAMNVMDRVVVQDIRGIASGEIRGTNRIGRMLGFNSTEIKSAITKDQAAPEGQQVYKLFEERFKGMEPALKTFIQGFTANWSNFINKLQQSAIAIGEKIIPVLIPMLKSLELTIDDWVKSGNLQLLAHSLGETVKSLGGTLIAFVKLMGPSLKSVNSILLVGFVGVMATFAARVLFESEIMGKNVAGFLGIIGTLVGGIILYKQHLEGQIEDNATQTRQLLIQDDYSTPVISQQIRTRGLEHIADFTRGKAPWVDSEMRGKLNILTSLGQAEDAATEKVHTSIFDSFTNPLLLYIPGLVAENTARVAEKNAGVELSSQARERALIARKNTEKQGKSLQFMREDAYYALQHVTGKDFIGKESVSRAIASLTPAQKKAFALTIDKMISDSKAAEDQLTGKNLLNKAAPDEVKEKSGPQQTLVESAAVAHAQRVVKAIEAELGIIAPDAKVGGKYLGPQLLGTKVKAETALAYDKFQKEIATGMQESKGPEVFKVANEHYAQAIEEIRVKYEEQTRAMRENIETLKAQNVAAKEQLALKKAENDIAGKKYALGRIDVTTPEGRSAYGTLSTAIYHAENERARLQGIAEKRPYEDQLAAQARKGDSFSKALSDLGITDVRSSTRATNVLAGIGFLSSGDSASTLSAGSSFGGLFTQYYDVKPKPSPSAIHANAAKIRPAYAGLGQGLTDPKWSMSPGEIAHLHTLGLISDVGTSESLNSNSREYQGRIDEQRQRSLKDYYDSQYNFDSTSSRLAARVGTTSRQSRVLDLQQSAAVLKENADRTLSVAKDHLDSVVTHNTGGLSGFVQYSSALTSYHNAQMGKRSSEVQGAGLEQASKNLAETFSLLDQKTAQVNDQLSKLADKKLDAKLSKAMDPYGITSHVDQFKNNITRQQDTLRTSVSSKVLDQQISDNMLDSIYGTNIYATRSQNGYYKNMESSLYTTGIGKITASIDPIKVARMHQLDAIDQGTQGALGQFLDNPMQLYKKPFGLLQTATQPLASLQKQQLLSGLTKSSTLTENQWLGQNPDLAQAYLDPTDSGHSAAVAMFAQAAASYRGKTESARTQSLEYAAGDIVGGIGGDILGHAIFPDKSPQAINMGSNLGTTLGAAYGPTLIGGALGGPLGAAAGGLLGGLLGGLFGGSKEDPEAARRAALYEQYQKQVVQILSEINKSVRVGADYYRNVLTTNFYGASSLWYSGRAYARMGIQGTVGTVR